MKRGLGKSYNFDEVKYGNETSDFNIYTYFRSLRVEIELICRGFYFQFNFPHSVTRDILNRALNYKEIFLLDTLKQIVVEMTKQGKYVLYSQIYSYFDLELEGCISINDYDGLKSLAEKKKFNTTFLWGCVENCVLLLQPPNAHYSSLYNWPVLFLDNENTLMLYATSPRKVICLLISEIRNQINRSKGDKFSATYAPDQLEFTNIIMTRCDIKQAEIDYVVAHYERENVFIHLSYHSIKSND